MKKSKLVVVLLAAVLAVGMIFALTACGPEEKPDPPADKSYQLTGSFTDDLGPLGKGFEFMLNLNEDGSAELARYNPYTYDASDAATNKNYAAKFMQGTWKTAQKDGVDCLQIKLAVKGEDGKESDASTSYAYDVAGEYSFDCSFPIVPGMGFTRVVTLKGGETKAYADANAFIQAKKKVFTAPEHIATFTDAEKGGTVYVQEDGTLLFYSGKSQYKTGSYYKTETEFGVIVGDAEITVTKDGNKVSFADNYDMGGGYTTDFTYVCDDISSLPNVAKPGVDEPSDKTVVGTYEGTNKPKPEDTPRGYKIELYDDGTCKLTFNFMTEIIFDCKYVKEGNRVTLSDLTTDNPYGAQLAGMAKEALVWDVNDADGTMKVAAAA